MSTINGIVSSVFTAVQLYGRSIIHFECPMEGNLFILFAAVVVYSVPRIGNRYNKISVHYLLSLWAAYIPTYNVILCYLNNVFYKNAYRRYTNLKF